VVKAHHFRWLIEMERWSLIVVAIPNVGFGSEAAADKRILSVCFGEFIADGYC
jgi:hypothetical protein